MIKDYIDYPKALELWRKAGDLGSTEAYLNIGNKYCHGNIVEMKTNTVEMNMMRAKYYWELASMGGDSQARHYLGAFEECIGNMERALKHFMIAVGDGYNDSLENIKVLFMKGHATKEDYAQALRAHQAYMDEIRSDPRDKAAAFAEKFKYY